MSLRIRPDLPLLACLALGCSAAGSDATVGRVDGAGGRGNAPAGTGSSGGGFNEVDSGANIETLGADVAVNGMVVDVHVIACDGDCADIEAVVRGGNPPFSYTWSAPSLAGKGPHRVCPQAETDYTVTVTDSAVTRGEFRRDPLTAAGTARIDVEACPGDDGGAPPIMPECAPPVRVLAALPAQGTPFTGALPDYAGHFGGAIYAIAQGQATLAAGCSQLLIAGDAAGTAPAGWDDHLLVEYRETPGGPVTRRWNYGGYNLSFQGQPVTQAMPPSVPGTALNPPVLNPLPFGYTPLAIDLMQQVPAGATTFELTLSVLDEANVGSTTDIWIIQR